MGRLECWGTCRQSRNGGAVPLSPGLCRLPLPRCLVSEPPGSLRCRLPGQADSVTRPFPPGPLLFLSPSCDRDLRRKNAVHRNPGWKSLAATFFQVKGLPPVGSPRNRTVLGLSDALPQLPPLCVRVSHGCCSVPWAPAVPAAGSALGHGCAGKAEIVLPSASAPSLDLSSFLQIVARLGHSRGSPTSQAAPGREGGLIHIACVWEERGRLRGC